MKHVTRAQWPSGCEICEIPLTFFFLDILSFKKCSASNVDCLLSTPHTCSTIPSCSCNMHRGKCNDIAMERVRKMLCFLSFFFLTLFFLFWGFVFTLAPSLSLTENSNQNVKRKVFASPPFHLPEHTETYCVLCARLPAGSLVGEIRSCQRWSRCCSISSRQCSPTLLPTFSTCALETTRSSQRYGPFRHTHIYTHTHLMTVSSLWSRSKQNCTPPSSDPALIWKWEYSWMQSNKCGCVLSREWVAVHELQHFCNLQGDSVGN